MSVPPEIRAVPRPVNTVVENTGKVGPKQYPVRMRAGTKYVSHRNPQPHNGRVIGHIVDGRFVPRQARAATDGPDMLSYGLSAFIWSVSDDILKDLESTFDVKQAHAIYAVAALRAQKPHISDRKLASEYDRCFLSKFCPGVPLSKNSVGKLESDLGKDTQKQAAFFKKRWDAVSAEHHVAIDGSLIQDTSKINDLSDYSRKSRTKGCLDISLLYAYDIETGEPICCKVYPGNCNDASAFHDFVESNGIDHGIIITDKGLPPKKIRDLLAKFKNLHYLIPVKRNDSRIKSHKLYEYQGILQGLERNVLYKKVPLGDGRFLYSFKDAAQDAKENRTYLEKSKKTQSYSFDDYARRRERFGTIVFESDQDLSPVTIYKNYQKRWLLELVFRQYKRSEYLDQTRVQSDFSVSGSEFVNFIATLITCRLIAKAEDAGLLDEQSFGDLKDDLSQAWRKTGSSAEPASDDGQWVHTIKQALESLEALGLSKPVPKPEPKKKGRHSKKIGPKPEFVGPKRPRGRPRKNHSAEAPRDI